MIAGKDYFGKALSYKMPELPDIIVYIEALKKRILNQTLQRVRIAHPFLVRTAEPSL